MDSQECQHEAAKGETWKEVCGIRVSRYRQCAAGCKITIAYCDAHGGDDRAVREMVLHHSIVHNQGRPDGNRR